MNKTTKNIIYGLLILSSILAASCTVSYKFNGASIDYSKIKTISISEFPNNAPLVYPQLAIQFNNEIQNIYKRQTRLEFVRNNGDLNIEGAIVGYAITPMAIGANALASENRLTLTIKVHFTNNVTDESTDNTYTAYRNFPSTSTLEDVQDSLIGEMIEEILDQIFNATVANW